MIKVAHLIDDCSMGGVTAALRNFDDARLCAVASSRALVVDPLQADAPHIGDDVIIVHFTVSWRKLPFLLSLRLKNRHTRIILQEHSYTAGFEDCKVRNRLRFRQMLKMSYACFDQVVAVSYGQAEWLRDVVRREKLRVIPQSRTFDTLQTVKPEDKGFDASVTFGAIGRFHEQKGFDDLIAAFRSPSLDGARLVIAGAGEEEARLRELAGDAPNIRFMGPTDDPLTFYRKVDCVVVPSRWEAFGLVASEAMAAGKLVVASDLDGLSEQVVNNGVLFPSGDIMALSKVLTRIVGLGRKAVIDFGERSRFSAVSRYDAMIEAWKTVFVETAYQALALRASSAAALSPTPISTSPGQYR